MPMMLQDWIHKFEEGTGSKLVIRAAALLAMVALAVFYNMAAFQNLSSPEAMDTAQLARNLAEGEGFTTDFIRPLSLSLVFQRATNRLEFGENPSSNRQTLTTSEQLWIDRLQTRHPDLANAPLYPLLMAGALKLNPYGHPDVSAAENFGIYTPDLWIAMVNQALLLAAAFLVFNLARHLFDEQVAWVSTVIFLGTELYWRFSISGLPTMLLIVLFLAVIRILLSLERESRNENPRAARLFLGAAATGLLVGMCALTQYAFALLILPSVVLLATLPYSRRTTLAACAGVAMLLSFAPWVIRNYHLSGTPFGTAGYAVFQETDSFPKDRIQRASHPDFREFSAGELRAKFVKNARRLLQSDLLRAGGNWAFSFFLVGLLVPFRNVSLRRIRTFLLAVLALLVMAQCLGTTDTGPEAGVVHKQNLVAVTGPLVFIFGTSLFFILLDQGGLKSAGTRLAGMGAFCLALSAPLILKLLPPHSAPIQYPPYFPPWIQQKSRHLDPEDWMMSDIPWAIAWYGNRSSVWLSHYYIDPFGTRYVNDFFQIHERIKPLSAFHLSARTLKQIDSESLWNWVGRTDATGANWEQYVSDWESFALIGIYLNNEVPTGFPLKNAPKGIFPELFLTDSEHIAEKAIQSP